jgi:hypothetical protein
VRLPHLPGAREPALARRRRLRAERRTRGIAFAALLTGGAVAATEIGRVWSRGSAPLPTEAVGHDSATAARLDSEAAARIAAAGAEALGQTVEVAVRGYQEGTTGENALLNLLGSFTLTWAVVRSSTHAIRRRGRFGPFGDLVLGQHHIHHFVPGILVAFLAGGASVVSRNSALDPWLAIPFGAGVALTLDESALLLKLDDVYWTEEGIVSVQISLAMVSMLSAVVLALRTLRRGERVVLEDG